MTTTVTGRNKLLLLIIALIAILIGYNLLSDEPPNTPPLTAPAAAENQSSSAANPDAEKANATLANTQQMLAGENTSVPVAQPAAVDNKQASVSVWQISNTYPDMPLPNGVVVYEPVTVDMESPAYPEPGQQVSLGLPGGEVVNAMVHRSSGNPNGDYSWRGYLEGYGTDYPVVMTYGANSVFATVTTPKGSYTLESINGSGWVYKNPSEFELSEPGKDDYLEAPRAH